MAWPADVNGPLVVRPSPPLSFVTRLNAPDEHHKSFLQDCFPGGGMNVFRELICPGNNFSIWSVGFQSCGRSSDRRDLEKEEEKGEGARDCSPNFRSTWRVWFPSGLGEREKALLAFTANLIRAAVGGNLLTKLRVLE